MKSKKSDERKVRLISDYLKSYGIDLDDPNFKDTPKRVVRMHKELFYGLTADGKSQIKAMLSRKFPSNNKDMVIIRDMRISSLCPHHLSPVRIRCSVAYIPNGKEVIGLSKIPRIVEIMSKRPVLQETLTQDIADTLFKGLDALGVMVIMRGEHSCIIDRGVKSYSETITSALRGVFLNPGDNKISSAKMEALSLLNKEM
jgi:GTP cyclohydrolase IA